MLKCLNWVFSPAGLLSHEKNPLNKVYFEIRFTLFLLSISLKSSHKNCHILKNYDCLKWLLCRNGYPILNLGSTSLLCKIHSLNEFNLNHKKEREDVWLLKNMFKIKTPKTVKIFWDAFRENILFQNPSNSVLRTNAWWVVLNNFYFVIWVTSYKKYVFDLLGEI